MGNLIGNQEKRSLLLSELNYFRSGSQVTNLFSGELCWLKEYSQIPSANVLHNVDGRQVLKGQEWLNDINAKFKHLGSAQSRFYLTQFDDSNIERLIQLGLKVTIEVGMIGHLAECQNATKNQQGELVLIECKNALEYKRKLYQECELGADGHSMQDGLFADFEQVKCDAGYMSSFLYYHNGILKGTVSLAVVGNFARLKNLYIHPHFRGQGAGKNIVSLLIEAAKKIGAKSLGTYAALGGTSQYLYASCGLQPSIRQVEGVAKI